MHGYVISIVATDALVLKHQDISSHSADLILILIDNIHAKPWSLLWTNWETKIMFKKNNPIVYGLISIAFVI